MGTYRYVVVLVSLLAVALFFAIFVRITRLEERETIDWEVVDSLSLEMNQLEEAIAILEVEVKELIARQERRDGIKAWLIPVTVTTYNPVEAQTDDTPLVTASNKKVKEGMVALSRDLEEEFDLEFGDEVYLLGLGRFIFEDRMHKRWRRRADILMLSEEEARVFGVRCSFLVIMVK